MYTHTCVSADDLNASTAFYDAALKPLGLANRGQFNDRSIGYSDGKGGMLLVMTPLNGEPATPANGGTIGFHAADSAAVDAFHAGGMANGGTDAGAPGPRPNVSGTAYGAYLLDPVGNKVCAFTGLAG